MNELGLIISLVGRSIDAVGVGVIVVGRLFAIARYVSTGRIQPEGYRVFRQDWGRGILLGLEFLIAAEIIRTVAIMPTLQDVLLLGLIVLIRTFLRLSLQV